MSMDKRLAVFLSDETARTNSDTITLTHEQIDRYIGSARKVVSKMLKYFASEGIVDVSQKGIKSVCVNYPSIISRRRYQINSPKS
jgi:CRP/FNR family transcriptional regulator